MARDEVLKGAERRMALRSGGGVRKACWPMGRLGRRAVRSGERETRANGRAVAVARAMLGTVDGLGKPRTARTRMLRKWKREREREQKSWWLGRVVETTLRREAPRPSQLKKPH